MTLKLSLARSLTLMSGFALFCLSLRADAMSVFDTPRFVDPGRMAIGLEPEVNLGADAGAAINFHYTHGINDLINVKGILGTGTSAKAFRIGAMGIFDIFPDVQRQPGIGLAFSSIYYRVLGTGRMEFALTPYIHKAFSSGKGEFEPFVAIPLGVAVQDGGSKGFTSISLGSMFKQWEKTRFVLEVGVAINNTNTFVSGGFVFFP